MKIGIIGAGDIGKLYARLWREAGHEILISSRNPSRLASFASELSIEAGFPMEAAAFGDLLLLAVNYETVDEAIAVIGPHVDGKLVIDATNPLKRSDSGGIERVIPDEAIAGVVMAARLPGARVAKAFTSLWTGHVEQGTNRAAPYIAMPFAADAPEDRVVVAKLIEDAGLAPVDLGTLVQSRPLDPGSPIWNVVLTPEELRAHVEAYRAELRGD